MPNNDSIKLTNRKKTLMIAHRGLSGVEIENTIPAFVAAGSRSYYGIESDVHITRDGKFVIFHDDITGRVMEKNILVEQSELHALEQLKYKENKTLKMPTLAEYINVCKQYEKVAVLELKNKMSAESISGIYSQIQALDYKNQTIFISFELENLKQIRKIDKAVSAQYLVSKFNKNTLKVLKSNNLDLDINYTACSREVIEQCHKNGILVNAWTVDSIGDAERLIDYGIDFITSNILE